MVDYIVIAVIAIAFFLAVRRAMKSKGCEACSSKGACSGKLCSSADRMVEDIEKELNID